MIHSAVVNGPLGTVGQALVRVLLAKGIKVYAICYPGDRRIAELPGEARVIELDMREIGRLPELVGEPVDAFFHLAWMGSIGPGRNDTLMQTENVRCALLAAQAAATMKAEVFVGVGSQAEHGHVSGLITPEMPCHPLTGYGIAKLCAGQMTRLMCHQLGIRHVWARILSAYGPGDGPLSVIPTIVTKLLKGEKPALTAGEQLWDFCYADDVGEALAAMAARGRDGAIYPIGSGQVRTLKAYFEATRDAIDPSLPLGIGQLPYPPNQVMHLQADISSLTADTGWVPNVPFEEGIRRTIDSFCARSEGNV